MPTKMQLGAETLERDASALFSFVDSICQQCNLDSESPEYLKSSVDFLEYIRELGEATKAYLNVFPANAPHDKRLYQDYRQKLETIRSGWVNFHQLIKPAVDADTLNAPYTLIEALTRRLNRLRYFEHSAFAIFHFAELNYLEVPISEITKTTERLKRVIPDQPDFPPDLGLIGIPYSQSSSLYLNCLISHEIGHFAFEKLQLKDRLLPEIQKALEQALGGGLAHISPENLDWSKDRMLSWAEELFCDLFAVCLTGPCYAFTYIETFGLTTILDPGVASGFSVTAGSILFTRGHPADLFRTKQHVLLLQKLGWWDEVDSIKSHYVDVLRIATGVDESMVEFHTTEQSYAQETLQAFLGLSPLIVDLMPTVMKAPNGEDIDFGVSGYKRFGSLVGQYLKEGVVPSTVFDGKDHWYPDTITLLNASMKFYLESLEELMKGIKDQKASLAGHRARWIKRLELLTSKAIEDYNLLVGEKGAIQVDGAFKRADRRSLGSADS
ncbi:MAG: hypothetical protein ACLPVW_10650 [Terriglobales bacterium]